MTRAAYGLHITGRVDSIEEVKLHEGTSKGGNPYKFYAQSITVTVGGELYEIRYQADEDPKGPLAPYQLDQAARIRVGSPRVFNGKVSFDAVVK